MWMPRGWPLGPDHSVRVEYGQPKTALIFMPKSRMRRRGYLVLSQGDEWQWCSVAHARAKVTDSLRIQREKDEIRRERPIQYLTRAGDVAILGA